MQTAIFYLNDLPLLLVIFECLMLVILLLVMNHGNAQSNLFLALFLIAVGLDAFDTLIYWNPNIKTIFLTQFVQIFFVLKFSVYLNAPMLYLYTKSIVYSDYKFTRREWLHLLPLALSPFYLGLFYYSLGDAEIYHVAQDYNALFNTVLFQGHLWARNIVYVLYGTMSYQLLVHYNECLKENYSNIEKIDHSWLRLLIVGFIAIWIWNFAGYILDLVLDPVWLPDTMGIIGNYFNFIFINTLVLYSLTHSNLYKGVQSSAEEQKNSDLEVTDPRHIAILVKAMEEDKFFLAPDITLEQLADHVSLSARQVSNIINRHFNKNFFEYVNSYRVEQAKQLLSQVDNSRSIMDVMADAGFNSKSVFHRYFKKIVNMTPREFRDSVLKKQNIK